VQDVEEENLQIYQSSAAARTALATAKAKAQAQRNRVANTPAVVEARRE
jgi:phage terminase Nu1 subunit (DNA packaging protein)